MPYAPAPLDRTQELGKTRKTGIKGRSGQRLGIEPSGYGCLPTKREWIDMRIVLALIAVLYSATALAQDKPPPTVGGKPLVQVKPKSGGGAEKPGKQQPFAIRMQACLDIEDGTKARLDCYDAVVPPKPNPKAPAAKGVMDCKFTKEEDERLTCYNGFVESIPRLPKS